MYLVDDTTDYRTGTVHSACQFSWLQSCRPTAFRLHDVRQFLPSPRTYQFGALLGVQLPRNRNLRHSKTCLPCLSAHDVREPCKFSSTTVAERQTVVGAL